MADNRYATLALDENKEEEVNHSCYRGCREAIKQIFDIQSGSTAAVIVQYMTVAMVFMSIVCVLAETVPDLEHAFKGTFMMLERVFTAFFTCEFVIKIWVAEDPFGYRSLLPNMIDLLATMPWYLDYACRKWFDVVDTLYYREEADAFQVLRLVRVLRLLKAAGHSEMISTIARSLWSESDALAALLAFMCIIAVFAATTVFFLECELEDTDFVSIPRSMWWAFSTISGVGYGDMVVKTPAGQCAAIVAMMSGVLVTPLAGTIMTSSAFAAIEKKMHEIRSRRITSHVYRYVCGDEDMRSSSTEIHIDKHGNVSSTEIEIEKSAPRCGDLIVEFQRIEEELQKTLSRLQNTVSAPLTKEQTHLLREQNKLWFQQVKSIASTAQASSPQ